MLCFHLSKEVEERDQDNVIEESIQELSNISD